MTNGRENETQKWLTLWLGCWLFIALLWRQYSLSQEPLLSAPLLGRLTLALLLGSGSYYGAKKYFRWRMKRTGQAWPAALMARWRLAHQLFAGVAMATAVNHAAMNVVYYQAGATPKLLMGSSTFLLLGCVLGTGVWLQKHLAEKKIRRCHWLFGVLLLSAALIHKFL
ncbi:hypothetical protein [Azotosporobacter soli]|uniref:hypothetical protein n=1 Tax=Azotosporobacter soli TaxID=3055040 RepID=UPI0031FED9ED